MPFRMLIILPAILVSAVATLPLKAQEQAPIPVTQVVDKIVMQEHAEVELLRQYSPLVETYIQMVRPDKELGAVPDGDRYFSGPRRAG